MIREHFYHIDGRLENSSTPSLFSIHADPCPSGVLNSALDVELVDVQLKAAEELRRLYFLNLIKHVLI